MCVCMHVRVHICVEFVCWVQCKSDIVYVHVHVYVCVTVLILAVLLLFIA